MEDSLVETEARRKEQKKDDLGRKIVNLKPNIPRKLNGRRAYQCERCDRVLYSKNTFDRHMAKHDEEDVNGEEVQEDEVEDQQVVVPSVRKKRAPSHSCIFCSQSFWRNRDFEEHIRIHTKERPFRCPHHNCERDFAYARILQSHMKSHSNARPHKCSNCELNFKTVKTLNKHKKNMHPINNSFQQLECPSCPAVFVRQRLLECHLKTHLDPPSRPSFPCLKCESIFTSKYNLQRHIYRFHNNVYKCSYCCHNFLSEDDLQNHKQKEGHNREKQFCCAICDVKFTCQKTLKRHLESDRHRIVEEIHKDSEKCAEVQQHLAKKNFVLVSKICCNSCESTFPTEQELTQHVNNVHNLPAERPFCCEEKGCDKSFKRKYHLKSHMEAVHSNLRKYACSTCEKKYKDIRDLKVHIRLHNIAPDEEEHPFCCKEKSCDKSFKRKDHLKSHMEAVHSNLRKFACSRCEKKYKDIRDLKVHIRLHNLAPDEEERPVCCKEKGCDKAFRKKDHLRNHVDEVHSNLRKYLCSRCGKKFNQYRNLRVHNIRHPDCDIFIRDEQSKHRENGSEREKLIDTRLELVDSVDSLVTCDSSEDQVPTTTPLVIKTLPQILKVTNLDDQVPTTAAIKTLQKVVKFINSDDESSTTQQPGRVTVDVTLSTLEIQQQQPVPALGVLQEQYAETESTGVTQMEREHNLNNDPAPPPVIIQQTENVDDTSNTEKEESVMVCEIIKQEADEYRVLPSSIRIQMEDEFRADAETAEELILQLITNINTMEVEETSTIELDNREEPEQPANPPLPQLPTEPRTETGVVQVAPSNERNESVAVAGTSKSGLSEDQPANKGRSMNLRKRDSSGKTAPPPPKRKYLPRGTTTQDESEDEETKAKREEESLKFFQLPRAENGFRIIPRGAIQVNPYLCMIKLEPDLPEGIKVEVESAEMSAD